MTNRGSEPIHLGAGPPWILGRRGAPREAPENTLAGFQRALELGADGFHTDVRRTRGADLVVFADEVLERTTDGAGRLAEHGVVELAGLDAGGWFAKRFTGEPVPLLDELLELGAERLTGRAPWQWIEIHESGVAEDLARRFERFESPLDVRVATRSPRLCHEALDAGLQTVFCTPRLDAAVWELAQSFTLAAIATHDWSGELGSRTWPCERWGLELDDPTQVLNAARGGLSD